MLKEQDLHNYIVTFTLHVMRSHKFGILILYFHFNKNLAWFSNMLYSPLNIKLIHFKHLKKFWKIFFEVLTRI